MNSKKFWETKSLSQLDDREWEALCDGCGRCCYRKILEGHLWNKKILNTRIACDLLDCGTCRCTDYEHRFERQSECIKLDRKKVKEFKWLPETCAYRLIHEGKPLPAWHPLISGTEDSVKKSGILVENGINERCLDENDDWYDYIID